MCPQALALLEKQEWAWRCRLRPRQVGVDPTNRDGYGVNYEDVHGLGRDIANIGWSWDETSKAVCIEEAPTSLLIQEFNVALAQTDRLAPVQPDSIRFGSVSCSHTNMFLRCMAAGVASDDEVLSDDGRLSLAKLKHRDAAFADAVENGLHWLVLSHRLRANFPELLSLIQSARNAAGQVARREHEVQVLLRLHHLALSEAKTSVNGQIPWERVRARVMASRPPCADELEDLSLFVAACGGGASATYLKDLDAFHKAHVNSELRSVKGSFFAAVATMDFGQPTPWLKMAFVKAQYTCPKTAVKGKICSWISASDLVKLKKTINLPSLASAMYGASCAARIELAEHMLREVRETCRLLGKGDTTKVLTTVDVTVVRFLMDKQSGSSVEHKTLHSVGHAFVQELHVVR